MPDERPLLPLLPRHLHTHTQRHIHTHTETHTHTHTHTHRERHIHTQTERERERVRHTHTHTHTHSHTEVCRNVSSCGAEGSRETHLRVGLGQTLDLQPGLLSLLQLGLLSGRRSVCVFITHHTTAALAAQLTYSSRL